MEGPRPRIRFPGATAFFIVSVGAAPPGFAFPGRPHPVRVTMTEHPIHIGREQVIPPLFPATAGAGCASESPAYVTATTHNINGVSSSSRKDGSSSSARRTGLPEGPRSVEIGIHLGTREGLHDDGALKPKRHGQGLIVGRAAADDQGQQAMGIAEGIDRPRRTPPGVPASPHPGHRARAGSDHDRPSLGHDLATDA